MTRLLHIAARSADARVWTPLFREKLLELGELVIVEDGSSRSQIELATLVRNCDILLTSWGSSPVPAEVAQSPGNLGYVCHITGTMRHVVPVEIIDAGIPVTNWGDAPAHSIAEGAMVLLLATIKDLHYRVNLIRNGGWQPDQRWHGGSLEGLNVGIYGYGVIGRRFVEMLRPFGAVIRVFDPYATNFPVDCNVVNSLKELFCQSEAIVIHAGLTNETQGSVTAELLAMLPNHGIIINTARGGIVDQQALFQELKSGRLRAGLDVLEPDYLKPDHPARQWDNCIFTAHTIGQGWPSDGSANQRLGRMHLICLDNLGRHLSGKPLRFCMDRPRYLRST